MFSQKFSDFDFFDFFLGARVGRAKFQIREIVAASTGTSNSSSKTTTFELSRPNLPNSASLPYLVHPLKESLMLVTISEAAKDYLHVSKSTVYRLAKQGAIQIVHVRGCARVTLQSIDRYFQELTGGYR